MEQTSRRLSEAVREYLSDYDYAYEPDDESETSEFPPLAPEAVLGAAAYFIYEVAENGLVATIEQFESTGAAHHIEYAVQALCQLDIKEAAELIEQTVDDFRRFDAIRDNPESDESDDALETNEDSDLTDFQEIWEKAQDEWQRIDPESRLPHA